MFTGRPFSRNSKSLFVSRAGDLQRRKSTGAPAFSNRNHFSIQITKFLIKCILFCFQISADLQFSLSNNITNPRILKAHSHLQ